MRDEDKYFQDSDEDEVFREFFRDYSGRFKSRWYASISNNPNNDMDEQDDSDDDAADSKASSDAKSEADSIALGALSTSNAKLDMILRCQNNASMRYGYIRFYRKRPSDEVAGPVTVVESGGDGSLSDTPSPIADPAIGGVSSSSVVGTSDDLTPDNDADAGNDLNVSSASKQGKPYAVRLVICFIDD